MSKRYTHLINAIIILLYIVTLSFLTFRDVTIINGDDIIRKRVFSFSVINCIKYGTIFILIFIVFQITQKVSIKFAILVILAAIITNYSLMPNILEKFIEGPIISKKIAKAESQYSDDNKFAISQTVTKNNGGNKNLIDGENSNSNITSGMEYEVPKEEQKYIDTVLCKITKYSTREEVYKLLGSPSRDIAKLKVNWWIEINGQKSRIGVYFSPSTGRATEIVLDGGVGRFYYRKDLEK